MNLKNTILIMLSIIFLGNFNLVAEKEKTSNVTIIPIEGPIEQALLYVIRRGFDQAVRNNSDAIILQMNTPGGAVNAAGEIISLIGKMDIPIYTYVDNGAYSAGAFIALATPRIYMSPGSVIGAATPMMMSPMGGVQDMPPDVKEKMTSAVCAMVRAAAEQGGHDPELAECMVRAELEYKVGRKIISKQGELLTMTNTEAEQLVNKSETLLSSGTAKNIDELLTFLKLEKSETNYIKTTGSEKFARAIASIAPILMLIGMGGLWLEFKTPGFGFFGLLGGTCLILFFFGHHIAGLSGMEDLIFFIIGIILIALELFVTPGFGILGISGLAISLFSLVNAMSERLPGSWKPISFEFSTFSEPLLNVVIAFIGSIGMLAIVGKYIPKTTLFSNITLNETISNNFDQDNSIGSIGITINDLRPSGTAKFKNKKLDVVTSGEFISKNTEIKIISLEGTKVIVRKI